MCVLLRLSEISINLFIDVQAALKICDTDIPVLVSHAFSLTNNIWSEPVGSDTDLLRCRLVQCRLLRRRCLAVAAERQMLKHTIEHPDWSSRNLPRPDGDTKFIDTGLRQPCHLRADTNAKPTQTRANC